MEYLSTSMLSFVIELIVPSLANISVEVISCHFARCSEFTLIITPNLAKDVLVSAVTTKVNENES